MRWNRVPPTLLALVASACAPPGREAAPEPPPVEVEAEALSLLGEELARPALPEDFIAEQSSLLTEARARLEEAPDDADALVWAGRRTAYLGRYREAIEIYTRGLELHPGDARFLRHRGHRYITTRQLDRAIEDLTRAAALTRDRADVVEPDGLPNPRGIPTSSLQSNIHYHLALAHYLAGDLEAARSAWIDCLEVSPGIDNVVAASHWLYMTLRRLGREAEAAEVLEPIGADLDIIENHDYYRLLRMYRGDIDPEALIAEVGRSTNALGSATLGYGIGNWHLYNGDRDRALATFQDILALDQWAAFGFIAAEAEMARASDFERRTHAWRRDRFERLLAEDGWLSVVALFWLEEGEFRFGTDPAADLVFPGSSAAEIYGRLDVRLGATRSEDRIIVHAAPGVDLLHEGSPVETLELVSDVVEGTTYLDVPPYRFYLIERSRRPFLRVLDLERPSRVEPPEIRHFPLDTSWRIEARFEPYHPPRTLAVPTILETTNRSSSPGALVFERDGVEHRLDAIDSGDDLFVIFADATTGAETYGGGRYVYTDLADADGRVVLDFNLAYNPPCVFTDFATCPLPPPGNRLELRVEAGELMPADHGDPSVRPSVDDSG